MTQYFRKELLIGCGGSKIKKVSVRDHREWTNLTTLDNNKRHKPDMLFDLDTLSYGASFPYSDDSLDEIHAYEVLEHIGRQGDYKAFFHQFSEFYRALKPNGLICATVPKPTSVWAWGDPSHTRVLPLEALQFLDQSEYTRQVGHTAMSDFRHVYTADFETVLAEPYSQHCNQFILKAIKPSRASSCQIL